MVDMAKKVVSPAKKRPNRTGRAVNVWVESDVGEALDRFINSQRVRPKITDVVELAVQEFLEKEGFWTPPKSP